MTIEKQSYLKVVIPPAFKINNPLRVGSTCVSLWGFTDEIQCEVEARTFGYDLYVRNGFDSETFDQKTFGFQISEVTNPFTTEETGSLRLEVYDKYDGLQYIASDEDKHFVRPSPFAFAFVQSGSQINGVSSIYTFSLTIGVDTPASTPITVYLPEELEFDESKDFVCKGILELTEEIACTGYPNKAIQFRLSRNSETDPEEDIGVYRNGTTIQFEIGHIKNHLSLKPTGSFKVKSSIRRASTVYEYNYNTTGLEIRNSEAGYIKIKDVVHSDTELGAQTSM